MFTTLLFFVAFVSLTNGKGLSIVSPSYLAKEFVTGPLKFASYEFDVTAEAKFIPTSQFCNIDALSSFAEEISGKILLVDYTSLLVSKCMTSPIEVAQRALHFNATGLVLKEQHGVGYLDFIENDAEKTLSQLPTVTLIRKDFFEIQFSKEKLVLNMKTPEINPWRRLVTTPFAKLFQAVSIGYLVIIFSIAIRKYIQFVCKFGVEISITQVCLCLEVVCFLIRSVAMVDPLGYYGIFPISVSSVILSLAFPFSVSSVLLMAFYWNDLLNSLGNFNKVSLWLREKKKTYMVSVAIVFGSLLVICCLDLATPNQQGMESLLLFGLVGLISIIEGFYFILNGFRLIRVFGKSNQAVKKNARVNYIVMSIGFSLVMVIVALGILTSPIYTINNYTVLASQFHLYWWMFSVSLFVVLAFQSPSDEKISEATSKNIKDIESGKKTRS